MIDSYELRRRDGTPRHVKEPQIQYVSYHNYVSYLNVNNYNDTKKNHATIVKLIATLTRATKTTV